MRRNEPVTAGVPLPAGLVFSVAELGLAGPGGRRLPLQASVLDAWPDGSARWVLLDFCADAGPDGVAERTLVIGPQPAAAEPGAEAVHVLDVERGVEVASGRITWGFVRGGSFPFSSITATSGSERSGAVIDPERSGVRIGFLGQPVDFHIADVIVHQRGPLRAEVEVRATPVATVHGCALDLIACVELFAGTGTARVSITMRNPRRADHPGGHWQLGDGGSVVIESASLVFEGHGDVTRVRCSVGPGTDLVDEALPFTIYQDSSGGDSWDSPAHKDRHGTITPRFRGYRVRAGAAERRGDRADPVVEVELAGQRLTVAVPGFWQHFPRAVAVAGRSLDIGLFPAETAGGHELQGGEQKTHVAVVATGGDSVTDVPLAWCRDPLTFTAPPDWVAASGAVPFLVPEADDPALQYVALARLALDPASGFVAKREAADEYGWRHFGDLPADHESAFQPAGAPFVSHYNNQYDAVAGFAVHYLRTGDPAWRQLMVELARHVRDVDIYHTTEDKAAYSGGLFWHTAHYVDAGTSTHRTYPAGTAGGGPSSEHNYNAGLMLHYFLTGERASRDAAIGLGQWVLDMDDGRKTPFRWLAGGATGLASFTVDYHGPGRGAGHSILACLTAHRLSGDRKYLEKAEELIRRCAHPGEDIARLNLLDAERRWSYTAFLQAVGVYVHGKAERGEEDGMHWYARSSLLHYARWMAAHERPYLDHPEQLEYPTETWAAQELRKADVFLWAALFSTAADRERFLERADWFFRYATDTLAGMPTRTFTRPVVLVLTNGYRFGWFASPGRVLPDPPAAAGEESWPPAAAFVPQKTRAIRRAKALAAGGMIGLALLLAGLLFS